MPDHRAQMTDTPRHPARPRAGHTWRTAPTNNLNSPATAQPRLDHSRPQTDSPTARRHLTNPAPSAMTQRGFDQDRPDRTPIGGSVALSAVQSAAAVDTPRPNVELAGSVAPRVRRRRPATTRPTVDRLHALWAHSISNVELARFDFAMKVRAGGSGRIARHPVGRVLVRSLSAG
jgi:hypothetical protein